MQQSDINPYPVMHGFTYPKTRLYWIKKIRNHGFL